MRNIYKCKIFAARSIRSRFLAFLIVNGAFLLLIFKLKNPTDISVTDLTAHTYKSEHGVIRKHWRFNDIKEDPVVIYDYVLKKAYFPDWFWSSSIRDLARSLTATRRKNGASLPLMPNTSRESNTANWIKLQGNIRKYSLYDPDDPTVEAVLEDMETLPIVKINDNLEGTQLKMMVQFENGGWAMLKPKRNIYRNSDRHFAEIAAFHLDRILGNYRVPPTVGRHINIMTELVPLFSKTYQETVFRSRSGKACFYGKCSRLCTRDIAACGTPDHIEVALQYAIPNTNDSGVGFHEISSPWKPTHQHILKPDWVSEEYVCNQTRKEFHSGKQFLLDVLDSMYFDMLIDNADRHHFAVYSDFFGNDTVPIMLDQGKGFKSTCEDNVLQSFLYERGGCCLISKTTFLKFYKLFLGPERLSGLMKESMASDPTAPVLSEEMLEGLDRRVNKFMLYISNCLKHNRVEDVILDNMKQANS